MAIEQFDSVEKKSEVDRLLVCGEQKEDGSFEPMSVRQVAERFGSSVASVARISTLWSCAKRREVFLRFQRYATPPLGCPPEERDAWVAEQCTPLTDPDANPDANEEIPQPPPEESTEPFIEDDDPNGEPPERFQVPSPTPPRNNPGKPLGRPRRNDAPVIPWNDIDVLLVMGEVTENEDGSTGVRYPTHKELAERYNVDRALVSRYFAEHNCKERREQSKTRVAIRVEEKLIENRATQISVTHEDTVKILDKFIAEFREKLTAGSVRTDSITDLNTVVRLKEFLQGGADSRQEIQGALTLSALQDRHGAFIELEREAGRLNAAGKSSDDERGEGENEDAEESATPGTMPCDASGQHTPSGDMTREELKEGATASNLGVIRGCSDAHLSTEINQETTITHLAGSSAYADRTATESHRAGNPSDGQPRGRSPSGELDSRNQRRAESPPPRRPLDADLEVTPDDM